MAETSKELTPTDQKKLAVMSTIKNAVAKSRANLELRGISPERQEKIFLAAIGHNPDVLGANQESLFNALRKCCSVGIVPDGNQGVCFVGKRGDVTVYFMAHGLRKMVQEYTGGIIKSGVVYETDKNFSLDLVTGEGGNPQTLETLNARNEVKNPKLVGAWCQLIVDGQTYPELYSMHDIESTRKLSPQGGKEGGIWDIHFAKMAEKSVVKRCIMKNQHIILERIENREVADQIRKDLESEDSAENMTVVDGVATEQVAPQEQGEVIDAEAEVVNSNDSPADDDAPPPPPPDDPEQGDFLPETGASEQTPPPPPEQQQGNKKTDL